MGWMFVGGLGALIVGAALLVRGASRLALSFGISPLVVGLTIVSFGTSSPELAVSIGAALEGRTDIAVGNVVGSNIFNILGFPGLTGLVEPGGIALAPSLLNFDIWVMLAVAFACLPVFATGRTIARWEGAVFLGYYAAYTTYLIIASQAHGALPAFSAVMMGFVVPITIVTMIVVMLRQAAPMPGP